MKKFLLLVLALVLVVLLLAAIVILPAIAMNNRMVNLQEGVHSAWGQVETVLQRRYDLIPNLVATVKGYAQHEKGVLTEVTKLRSQWAGASSLAEKVQASNQMEAGLGRLMVVLERYPELKANANFRDLQYELAGTENRITVERQRYNEAVRAYNTAIRQFPGSVIAGMRGFQDATYFETAPAAKEAPKVDFGTEK